MHSQIFKPRKAHIKLHYVVTVPPGSVVVQPLSRVGLFETPWTAACQASLSFTISWHLLKLMSIETVMPSNQLILHRPLLLLQWTDFSFKGLFQWIDSLHQVAKYWSFSFSISPSEYSRLISFRIDWFDLLALQGTLKSLLHNLKASILQHSAFFTVQLSRSYKTTEKP